MRRRFLLGALVCLLAAIGARATTVSGNLKDLGMNNVTTGNTFVRFTLEGYGANIARVTGTNVIATPAQDFAPDSGGNISGSIQGNDTISVGANAAGGTWYRVCIYYQGQEFQCADYTITGTSWNFNSATPNTTNPAVTAPTGDSTYARLDGGNQPFTAAITVPDIKATGIAYLQGGIWGSNLGIERTGALEWDIQNGTFEANETAGISATDGIPGWESFSATSLSLDTTSPYDGGASLKVVTPGGDPQQGATISEGYEVTPGETIKLTVEAHGDGTVAPEAWIGFWNFSGPGAAGSLSATGTSSTSWQALTFTGTVPASVDYAIVVLGPSGTTGGTTEFDDIKIETLSLPEVIAPTAGPDSAHQNTLPSVNGDTFALLNATQTLTNKTLTSPTSTGTDNGAETLGSKTLTAPVINGASTGTGVQGTDSKLATMGAAGSTGNVACQDANSGITTSGCPSQFGIQAFYPSSSCTWLSQNVVATTATQLCSETITMPTAGCPCRLHFSYHIFWDTGSADELEGWVSTNDINNGTVTYGDSASGSSGASGAYQDAHASGYSKVTYANSASVTVKLYYEAPSAANSPDGIHQAGRYAPDNTGLQLSVVTSN